jgi:hypothetical protein
MSFVVSSPSGTVLFLGDVPSHKCFLLSSQTAGVLAQTSSASWLYLVTSGLIINYIDTIVPSMGLQLCHCIFADAVPEYF